MDPYSGQVYTPEEAEQLSPEALEKLVRIDGTPEQVRVISEAVRAQARRRNKAARKARRAGRSKR